jgi:tetratricopeptide (TPR) repeat protein
MAFNPQKIRMRQLQAAEGYIALSMPEHALRELDQIGDVGSHDFQMNMLRGEALLLKLDHQHALDAYRQAHIDKPTELGPLLRMAWCLKRVDQLPQAIDIMKLAYQFHKSVPLVLYNMACYYALAGDKENALSWLGRSLRMDREYLDKIADETDFDSLRNDPDFQHLLELTTNQQS